jgi:hypothetical protein
MSDATVIVLRGALAFMAVAPAAWLGVVYLGGVLVGMALFALSLSARKVPR